MDYLKNFIIKDRPVFLPLIFTDVYISAKCLVIGGVTLGKNINDKRKDNVNIPEFVKQHLSEYMSPHDYDYSQSILKYCHITNLDVMI